MKTHELLSYLVLPLLVGWLAACNDHVNPSTLPGSAPGRLRVKTITRESPNNPTSVSAFQYDGQGRLVLIVGYFLPDSSAAPVENTVYQYNAQNQLTQVQRTTVRRGSGSETYTLNYNGAGQVSGLVHQPSTFSLGLSYLPNGQPSGYSKGISVGGLSFNGGGGFTFTGFNLTQTTENYNVIRLGGPSIPVASRSSSTNYAYDDKINPFYGVFIIPAPGLFGPSPVSGSFGPYYTLYGGVDNQLNLSQNNPTRKQENVTSSSFVGDIQTTYTYTYNPSYQPISRVSTVSSAITETLTYTYELY
ncbi:hypothetical protein [Spirosoma sordidisoli]|uniref:YD repeat-containing protein n=1 Tax=Spirosoma sordidisoli TaxID=2502893 RepID=A0A4Q2US76_9BACT|nr:hypothetical protein [Spirosoma sordidisoli]RYC69689.1 hypothetical protein EQG79_13905 [Spirosoma sordidisoli]